LNAANMMRFGLTSVADALSAVAAGPAPSAKAMLRAVSLLDRARALTRPLPWLHA
jgi:hypothetical protein